MDKKHQELLQKILDEITFLTTHTDSLSYEDYIKDPVIERAVAMSLLNIGELANGLTFDFYAKYPSIPWRDIIGLRHAVAHGYGALDFDIVWETIKNDIPNLKTQLEKIITLEP